MALVGKDSSVVVAILIGRELSRDRSSPARRCHVRCRELDGGVIRLAVVRTASQRHVTGGGQDLLSTLPFHVDPRARL